MPENIYTPSKKAGRFKWDLEGTGRYSPLSLLFLSLSDRMLYKCVVSHVCFRRFAIPYTYRILSEQAAKSGSVIPSTTSNSWRTALSVGSVGENNGNQSPAAESTLRVDEG